MSRAQAVVMGVAYAICAVVIVLVMLLPDRSERLAITCDTEPRPAPCAPADPIFERP